MEANDRIASQLRQISALLAEQGVQFKPAAYLKAAKNVEELDRDVSKIDDRKQLMEIPGVGEAIADKILEFFATGKIKHLQELQAAQGGLSAELMDVEDLGPKRVRELQKLGITTVAALVKAAEAGKLRDLPRMSETMEQKILNNARNVTERSKRYPREEVVDDVKKILETIQKVPGVERVEAAGSFRRHKSTVGDIDIIIVSKNREKVMDAIAKLPLVRDVVAKGDTKMSFNLKSLLRVDLRFIEKNQWGAALLYFTGDKEHNISLRKKAIEKGWKLNEYALTEDEKIIASKEEKDIYEALGFSWIEPQKRTGLLPT